MLAARALVLLAAARRLVVDAALQLVRQAVHLEALRVVVRIAVALAATELARAGIRRGAKRRRREEVPALPHVGAGRLERDVGGIRLGRSGEVDRCLREVETRLREADV